MAEITRLRGNLARLEAAESRRREALDQLRTLNANLMALIENTDEFILFSDRQARPVLYNSAYARVMKELLGIDMEPGLQPHTLIPDEARRWWDQLHARALAGERFSVEYSHDTGQGPTRYFEVSFNPILQDGQITGFSEFTKEITDRKLAEQARRDVRRRIADAVEDERRRIAGDLHDSLGQTLISLQMKLKTCLPAARQAREPDLARVLRGGIDTCKELVEEVRQICHDLYPPTLETLGLAATLRQLATDCSSGPARVIASFGEGLEHEGFPRPTEIALFRIAQEAVDNALRHASADAVEIGLRRDNGQVLLTVTDDGRGFDVPQASPGLGLQQMQARAEALGGELEVDSGPAGTAVRARLPGRDEATSRPTDSKNPRNREDSP